MKTLLIVNTVVLILALIFLVVSFVGWFKAEKKLAKFNQSKFFKAGK